MRQKYDPIARETMRRLMDWAERHVDFLELAVAVPVEAAVRFYTVADGREMELALWGVTPEAASAVYSIHTMIGQYREQVMLQEKLEELAPEQRRQVRDMLEGARVMLESAHPRNEDEQRLLDHRHQVLDKASEQLRPEMIERQPVWFDNDEALYTFGRPDVLVYRRAVGPWVGTEIGDFLEVAQRAGAAIPFEAVRNILAGRPYGSPTEHLSRAG